ncbi:hypothetical protein KY361_05705 [Candidatus Woesearchaeota archaeon]|nr:hypothetical protein [Candidatus Woesearchaeota archaeon]
MNKANKITPYLLPIITIIILLIVFITKPKGITGLAVAEPQDKQIRISSTTIIPENSIVEIIANNQTYTLTIEEFMSKSGNAPKSIYSEIPEINYSGKGYVGSYSVNTDKLGLSIINTSLKVNVIYKDIIISKSD